MITDTASLLGVIFAAISVVGILFANRTRKRKNDE